MVFLSVVHCKHTLHPDPTLTPYGAQIPVVTQTKFLGVVFDSKLNFKAHIDYVRKKCEKPMNLLKWCQKWIGVQTGVLEYGYEVFSSARKSYLKKIGTHSKPGLAYMPGSFQDFSNSNSN